MGSPLGPPKNPFSLGAAHNNIFPKGKKINVLVVFSSLSPGELIHLGGIPYHIIINDFKNTVRYL